MNSAKALPNSSNTQLANDAASCDWQRALGIRGKDDNSTANSATTNFPAPLSSSQTRTLPRNTRVSVHSDDDLGLSFARFLRNFL